MSVRRSTLALASLLAFGLAGAGSARAAVVCQTPSSEALRVRHESGCAATEVELPIEVVTISVGSLAAPEKAEREQRESAHGGDDSGDGPR